jgi:hypothetical protein
MIELNKAEEAFSAAKDKERQAHGALEIARGETMKAYTALEVARRKAAAEIPVDRDARTLTDGSPVADDHRDLKPSGQQKGYVVLSESERAKGFVRPVRRSYKHLKCGGTTTMGDSLAETYARDPSFYSGTFCCDCGTHFPVGEDGEFVWSGTDQKVGT